MSPGTFLIFRQFSPTPFFLLIIFCTGRKRIAAKNMPIPRFRNKQKSLGANFDANFY